MRRRVRWCCALLWLALCVTVAALVWEREYTARAVRLLGGDCYMVAVARYPVDANGFVVIDEASLRWQCRGGKLLEVGLWMRL